LKVEFVDTRKESSFLFDSFISGSKILPVILPMAFSICFALIDVPLGATARSRMRDKAIFTMSDKVRK